MEKDQIRFRYKKTGEIFTVPRRFLFQDGTVRFTPPDEIGRNTIPRTYIKPNEYEIIPQEDFFEFRRQTARQILCIIMQKESNYDNDSLIDKAIEITDKFIEKL